MRGTEEEVALVAVVLVGGLGEGARGGRWSIGRGFCCAQAGLVMSVVVAVNLGGDKWWGVGDGICRGIFREDCGRTTRYQRFMAGCVCIVFVVGTLLPLNCGKGG